MSRLQNTSTSVMKQRVLKAVLVQVLMTKNPISALMEACAQAGLKVTFQEYDESLRGFDKIFTCDVTVDGVLSSCRAYGPTKKEAKGNAARKAIEELTFDPSLGNSSTYKMSQVSSESRISPLHPKTAPPKGPETVENYIGTLQEYTAAHRWPTPKYSEDMRGQDHCKEFIVKCNVKEWTSQGIYGNKKTAKQLAAKNMMKLITSSTSGDSPGCTARLSTRLTSSNRSSSPGSVHSPTRQSYRSGQDEATQNDLAKLQRKTISRGMNLEWKYLRERGVISNNHMCFVRVHSDPVIVCSGEGLTKECARNDAAHNALQCWIA
ncbi:interferon-inducible double-stranded RNA-dependent protein kinase activator A homolog [Nematostella vectensis]|uniref:interferon-inducible double-stranded RNA-dependent protein kinase activator A homolog n=1 Tax=Nematostella vectensis TaxID=45351 RepID=UPI0020771CB2|nr:interferon-inducible double-stranded RNA-dependent protein kinase activator A homolog [Nematostella vectensis]